MPAKTRKRKAAAAASDPKRARVAQAKDKVKAASAGEDVKFEQKGGVEVRYADSLSPEQFEWAMKTTETNMAALYETCPEWGWKPAEKKKELKAKASRFLLAYLPVGGAAGADGGNVSECQLCKNGAVEWYCATCKQMICDTCQTESRGGHDGDDHMVVSPDDREFGDRQESKEVAEREGRPWSEPPKAPKAEEKGMDTGDDGEPLPVGFVNLRYSVEEGQAVLYIWDMQVDKVQRKGVGTALMNAAIELASKFELDKLMLTVFKANPAIKFYKTKFGFVQDETDPTLCDPDKEVGYEILQKPATAAKKEEAMDEKEEDE